MTVLYKNNSNAVMQFQVFLSNFINFQTDLVDLFLGTFHVLPLQVRLDKGVLAMKRYFTLPIFAKIEPHH